MEKNYFPPEFIAQFSRCFDMLSKCNINFFNDDNSKLRKYWKMLYLVPLIILHNIAMFGFMININSVMDEAFEIAYMVSVCLVTIQAIVKAAIIIYKRVDIEKLVTDLGSMWRTSNLTKEQQLKKESFMKRLKYSQAIYYWSNTLGALQHLFEPLILVLVRRYILGQDCELKLPFGAVYPYNPTESWLKFLPTYAFQAFTLYTEVQAYIGSEFLMITLCANLTVEFKLLREDLIHVPPTIESNDIDDQLAFEIQTTSRISIQDVIRRHQQLIKLATHLDDIFNKLVFVNFSFISFNTCFFGFAAVVAQGAMEKFHNSVGVVALLLPIYIFCYYGESLKEESLGIADSAYTNQWYKGDIRYQKIIIFIITRSQHPCCMTALRYVPITLNTFTKVLSTTWSYFSLLTSVYLSDD